MIPFFKRVIIKCLTVFYNSRYENLSERMYPALKIRRESGCAMIDQNHDPEDYVQFVREFNFNYSLEGLKYSRKKPENVTNTSQKSEEKTKL